MSTRKLWLAYAMTTYALSSLAGCSGDAQSASSLACLRSTELGAQCLQRDELVGDDRLYVVNDCADVGGRVVDACPTDDLIGTCRSVSKEKSAQGFVDRPGKMHYYAHSMLDREKLAQRWRGRCQAGAGEWTDAP